METKYLSTYVTKLLFFLGFSPRTKGFAYIREIAAFSYFDNQIKLNQSYALVAEKTHQPIEAIQTAVRTALKNAQAGKSFKQIETLMGANFIQPHYLVPPREFISLLVEYLIYFWDGKQEIDPIPVKYNTQLH